MRWCLQLHVSPVACFAVVGDGDRRPQPRAAIAMLGSGLFGLTGLGFRVSVVVWVSATSIWNSRPISHSTRSASSEYVFRSHLKTELFQRSYA